MIEAAWATILATVVALAIVVGFAVVGLFVNAPSTRHQYKGRLYEVLVLHLGLVLVGGFIATATTLTGHAVLARLELGVPAGILIGGLFGASAAWNAGQGWDRKERRPL